MYALFEVVGELLRPVEWRRLDRFDDDLVTIQKYPGKTNEQFTKLLLNVTLLASDSAAADARAAVPGARPALRPRHHPQPGADVRLRRRRDGRRPEGLRGVRGVHQTWLRQKRIKHRALESGPVRRERKVVGRRLRIELGADQEEYKAGETSCCDVVNADTARGREFFRPETFDLVVADAPYGVQHGSRTAGKGLAREPAGRCSRTAAPVWARLLRPGGALGISWNTHVGQPRRTRRRRWPPPA